MTFVELTMQTDGVDMSIPDNNHNLKKNSFSRLETAILDDLIPEAGS